MKEVAVIGNSHVGALKEGWDQIAADHPGVALRFFAVPKPLEAACGLDGLTYGLSADAPARLGQQATQINGDTAVDLADCDIVLYAGREFPFQTFRSLIGHYDIDGLVETGRTRHISLPAFKALSAPLFAPLVPDAAWRDLPGAGRSLYLALKPMISERAREAEESPAFWRAWLADPAPHMAYYDGLLTLFADHLAQAGIGFFRQPPPTLCAEGLTKAAFNRNARKLAAGQPATDLMHMNADYGIAFLRAFFAETGLAGSA